LEPEKEPSSLSQTSLWPLALLGILVSWAAFSQRPQKEHFHKSAHPQNSTPDESSDAPPRLVANLDLPTVPPQDRSPNRDKELTPVWRKIAECAAILIALGLLVANIFQTRATQKAAKAAEDANKIANDNLVRVQRPWLAVDGAMVTLEPISINTVKISSQGPQIQMRLTVGFWIKNFGVAPAFHTGIYIAPVSYQRGSDIPALNAEFDRTVTATCRMADLGSAPVSTSDTGNGPYIFPNNRFPMQWPINATSANPQLDTWLTVVGCITYRDQFKNSAPHHTHFCFRSPKAIIAITAKQAFGDCGQNEEAD
jgi:hypothetical protein